MQDNKLIKVMTFNIHKGFGYKRNFTIEQTKAALRELDLDVLCLQEVQGHHSRKVKKYANWPDAGHLEYLADELWPHFAYGKNAVYQAGHHGNAILSKNPLIAIDNYKLNRSRFFSRSILYGETIVNGQKVHLFCIHFSLSKLMRSLQLNKLEGNLLEVLYGHEPVIFAGDTNDPKGKVFQTFAQKFNLVDSATIIKKASIASFPAFKPCLPLDRIYTRGFHVKGIEALSVDPWNKLSDHLPIVCDLELKQN